MKLLIVLTLFVGFSTINSISTDDDSLDSSEIIKLMIQVVSSLVNHWEKLIPGWDVNAALDVNVIKLADNALEAGDVLGWNPDDDIEDNLVNVAQAYFNLLPLKGVNINESISANLAYMIEDIDVIPLPPFISKEQFEAKITEKILNSLSSIPEIDVNQSVHDNLINWISLSLEKVQVIDPSATAEKQVNYLIDLAFDEIKLTGFSPSKTLDTNIVDVLQALL
ncbi:uncharacterized protein LOC128392272 isoform X1 [Panonychus citri]|uniref:uncharacterized protein LOC128392272 isoform X1 n=2 Tax=Panonychus citri TaxID=50023 RepID=UPI002306EFD1|nr:uncharacterized protein LOC128392272 isoform X1 [Panonychus citri]